LSSQKIRPQRPLTSCRELADATAILQPRLVLWNMLVDSLARTVIKVFDEFFSSGTIYNEPIAYFLENGGLCFLKSIQQNEGAQINAP
jgi:hypothetical protein